MKRMDPFTLRRMLKFVPAFREKQGHLPTLKDFSERGFDADMVASAEAANKIEKFYLTLTNGTVVKGYKLVND